jgi:uncharacterized protein (DUF433 family)
MSVMKSHPGRGPRLPQTRISVQDLLVHFKRGESDEQIAVKYPTIDIPAIRELRQFYMDHTEDVLAYEQEVVAFRQELWKRYHRSSPLDQLSQTERIKSLKENLTKKISAETNGAHRFA